MDEPWTNNTKKEKLRGAREARDVAGNAVGFPPMHAKQGQRRPVATRGGVRGGRAQQRAVRAGARAPLAPGDQQGREAREC